MPRFNSSEEKLAYMKAIAPVLLMAGVPSVQRKDEQGNVITEVDPKYLEEVSKDDRSKVAEKITTIVENKKAGAVYARQQMRETAKNDTMNYYGRFKAEILDLGTEEQERWNLTMSRMGTSRAGQVKMVKTAVAEMFSVDLKTISEIVLGERPMDISPKMLRVSRVGFLADNLSSMVADFTKDEMDPEMRTAVVRQLKAGKALYEDYLALYSRYAYSTSALAQSLPSNYTPDEKTQTEIVKFAADAKLADRKINNELIADGITMYSFVQDAAKFRKYRELDARVKRELGEDYVDLINDRSLVIRDKNGKEIPHKDAITKLLSPDFPEDEQHKIRDLFSFEHVPQKESDLIKKFVEEELKNPPKLSEEELKEEKELRERELLERKEREEAEKRAKQEKKLAQAGCKKLDQMITDKMKTSDPLLKQLSYRLKKVTENAPGAAAALSAAAISVIHEYGSLGGSQSRENKVMIALASLAVVRPQLATNLSSEILRANPRSGIRLEKFMKEKELRSIPDSEKNDFDLDWFKNNSHVPADLKTTLAKIDKDLDPWYHHNSPEFNLMTRQMKTYLSMLDKKPMSQATVNELADQVKEAALSYAQKSGPSHLTGLGGNRLKMAIAIVGVIDLKEAEKLVKGLNKQRPEKKQLDLNKILRLEGLEPNMSREAKIGDMGSDIAGDLEKLKEIRSGYTKSIEALEQAVKASAEAQKLYESKKNNTVARLRGEFDDYAKSSNEKKILKAAGNLDNIQAQEQTAKAQLDRAQETYAVKTAEYISKNVLKNALSAKEHDLLQNDEMERRGVCNLLTGKIAQNKRFREIFKGLDLDAKMHGDLKSMSDVNREALEIGRKLCDAVLAEQGISKKVQAPKSPVLKNNSLEI